MYPIEDWEREHLKERIYIEEERMLILKEIIAEEELAATALASSREIRKFAINDTNYTARKRPRFIKKVARHSPVQYISRTSKNLLRRRYGS